MPLAAQSTAVEPPFMHALILALLLAFSFFSHHALAAEENAFEYLLRLKSSLANSDPSLRNWNSSVPPCSGNRGNWIGVLCFNGYVWGLQLEKMNLAGQIDVDSLIPLRFLRTLSFMNNKFQGKMPDWRKLGALKSLYLSNNRFSGEIPEDAFRGMTSLKKVHLADNEFTGRIPASLESPKLIELRLENNQFTGNIPEISSDNLKVLNVSNNQLEGPIPAPLLNMDPSSFSGNKALCGKPEGSECDPPIPPLDLEPSLNNSPPIKTPPPTTTNAEKNLNSRIYALLIIGIISIVVGLLLIILLLLIYWRSRRLQTATQLEREHPTPQHSHDEKSDVSTMAVLGAAPVASYKHGRSSDREMINGGQTDNTNKVLTFVDNHRRDFDLPDLLRASAEMLGSGNLGGSYKADLDVDAGGAAAATRTVVVKRFKLMSDVAKEDFHEHMRRLGRLKHPNLLPLIAYLYRKEEKLLVFDYQCNGSLAARLHGKHASQLTWPSRLKIIKGIAKGLAYLHGELVSVTVPHGHLKSSNVLLDGDFKAVLTDYALAPVVNPSQLHQVLAAYKSPEWDRHGGACRKSDVWCLGILILEILTGRFVGEYGSNLAGWIGAIVGEFRSNNKNVYVFDKEMGIVRTEYSYRIEMEKLLEIGIACCREDVDERCDLEEAVKRIEQVQESFSTVGDDNNIGLY